MNTLHQRIEALEQKCSNAGNRFQAWFKADGVYCQNAGVPVELPTDARGIVFVFTDELPESDNDNL